MLSLLLCIGCSTLLIVIFKLFSQWKIKLLQAIVFNYITAFTLGFTLNNWEYSLADIVVADWSSVAFIVGVGFITVFYLIGLTAKYAGVSITSIATKMSLIVPVIMAWILYQDSMGWVKITGIALAIPGIYLSSTKRGKLNFPVRYIWFPVLVFIGSGILDTLINFAKKQQLALTDEIIFTSTVFGVAGCIGLLLWFVMLSTGKDRFSWKALVGGIALGIPNFGSIYFLLQAFSIPGWESSQVIPVINVGIVLTSALVGMIFFREKLDKFNWLGILLASLSIGLIAGIV